MKGKGHDLHFTGFSWLILETDKMYYIRPLNFKIYTVVVRIIGTFGKYDQRRL